MLGVFALIAGVLAGKAWLSTVEIRVINDSHSDVVVFVEEWANHTIMQTRPRLINSGSNDPIRVMTGRGRMIFLVVSQASEASENRRFCFHMENFPRFCSRQISIDDRFLTE